MTTTTEACVDPREVAMYGTSAAKVLDGFDERLFAKLGDDGTMYLMGMLSNVQEEIAHGMTEEARQTLNCAKLIIAMRFSNRSAYLIMHNTQEKANEST